MRTDRLFQILIVIFAAAGIYFWTAGNKDGILASFVFAAVCFFLSIRFQAKSRMKKVELEKEEQQVQ